MRNILGLTIATALLAAGCSNNDTGPSSSGVTGSAGITGGTNQASSSTSGGSHGSSTSGSASNSSSSTSSGTTATIGTTGSNGTSGSGGECALLPDGSPCAQDDAGAGECCGSGCVSLGSPANCGGCGVVCPSGSACQSGPSTGAYCEDTLSPSRASCPQVGDPTSQICAAGMACVSLAPLPAPDGGPGSTSYRTDPFEISAGCVTTACDASSAGALCDANGQEGRCCNDACVAINSTVAGAPCGLCGVTCPTGQFCNNLVCTPTPTCSATNLGLNCPAADGTLGACCGSGCVNLNTDATNCGNCGVACQVGQVCLGGACALPDGGYPTSCDPFLPPDPTPGHPPNGGTCPNGTTCEGQNAIACDLATCAAGDDGDQCAGADPIWSNNACCGSQCVDIAIDDQNCGGCGVTCGAGHFCASAACLEIPVCSNTNANVAECPVSDGGLGTCCASGCTDLEADPANCGECDVQCPTGVSCDDGFCEGEGLCADAGCSAGFDCVTHFGEAECVPATCQASYATGPCAASDSSAGACCPAGCVDLGADSQNCGFCGHLCGDGGFCDEGTCAPNVSCTTAATSTACQLAAGAVGSCCPSGCVDTSSDATNCGGCGATCPTGATCTDSSCSSYCGPYGTDTCPNGTTCLTDEGICVLSACGVSDNGDECTPDGQSQLTCCGAVCDDLSSDSANCGTCGLGCDAGQDCLFGSCQAAVVCSAANVGTECSTGHSTGSCCPTGCADIATDSANCGGCGEACPTGWTCTDFSCGFIDGGFLASGCSGVTCPNGTQCSATGEGTAVCLASSCAGKDGETCAVDGGFGAVLETCCGGTCLDLESDDANCGTCGSPCAAGSFCLAGQCTASPVCSTNTQGEACPFNSTSVGLCCGTGCVDTTSDANNCGACGYACPGEERCTQSYCEFVDGGSIFCSGGNDAGCPSGTACPTNDTVCYPETCALPDQSICALGAITGSCCAAGPCTNTLTDNANCGFCGNPCTGSTTCMSGTCQ